MVSIPYQKDAPGHASPITPDRPTRTRALELATLIRRSIQSGERAPGDRLPPERELALQLGVARPTLRDALKILQREGYVLTRRGATGGTFVRELDLPAARWFDRMRSDRREVDDIIDFREGVETHLARLAALRRDADDLAEMQDSLDALDTVETRAAFRQADGRFHAALGAAARSPYLADALAWARSELFLPTEQELRDDQIDDTRADHQAILAAIVAGDPERAAGAVARHMQSTRAHLSRAFDVRPRPRGTRR